MNRIDCIFVLGMHRSGTSVLAGCLHILGVNLGESLMGPNKNNPIGYWENNDIVAVHDILFNKLGVGWDMVGSMPDGWLDSNAASSARKSIKKLLDYHYGKKGLWAIKDPRMCRLMPLWLPILDEMDQQPGFLLTLRHPIEVAKSLGKRDGFGIRKGLLLWLAHNRDAFAACRGRKYSITSYDQLLTDPLTLLDKIENDLQIEFPKPLRIAYPEILEFVRPELKSQHTAREKVGEEVEFAHFSKIYQHILLNNVKPSLSFEMPQEISGQDRLDILFPTLPLCSQNLKPCTENADGTEQGAEPFAGVLVDELLAHIGDCERLLRVHPAGKERAVQASASTGTELYAQIFLPTSIRPQFTEEQSKKFTLAPERWIELVCDIPDPIILSETGLRVDPMNTNGIIHFGALNLIDHATGMILLSAVKPEDFKKFRIDGHAFELPGNETFTMFSYGNDPRLIIAPIPKAQDCPLKIQIWIKVRTNQKIIHAAWKKLHQKLLSLETGPGNADHKR
jgi:hypothetical protein